VLQCERAPDRRSIIISPHYKSTQPRARVGMLMIYYSSLIAHVVISSPDPTRLRCCLAAPPPPPPHCPWRCRCSSLASLTPATAPSPAVRSSLPPPPSSLPHAPSSRSPLLPPPSGCALLAVRVLSSRQRPLPA
jgi:hypothetical protein